MSIAISNMVFRWDIDKPLIEPQIFYAHGDILWLIAQRKTGNIIIFEQLAHDADTAIIMSILDKNYFNDSERLQLLFRRACELPFGRNMTKQEWAKYMIGIPYHKTCENWYIPNENSNIN